MGIESGYQRDEHGDIHQPFHELGVAECLAESEYEVEQHIAQEYALHPAEHVADGYDLLVGVVIAGVYHQAHEANHRGYGAEYQQTG